MERRRLDEEKMRWLESEKKKLGEQMERKLEDESEEGTGACGWSDAAAGRRVEKEDIQEFHVAGGPLDRPSAGKSMRGSHRQVASAGLTELLGLKTPLSPHSEANLEAAGAAAGGSRGGRPDSLHELQLQKDALPNDWVRFEEAQTFFS
eukprot:580997-Hanusia_phi.AAC.2